MKIGYLHEIVLNVLHAETELCQKWQSSSEDPAAEYSLDPNE
jgi:hypothetical protein